MSLDDVQRADLEELVSNSLDAAEAVWDQHQPVFEAAATETLAYDSYADSAVRKAEIAPSRIPNIPFVSSDYSEVKEYICLVADMRDSSEHLMQAYSKSKPTYQMMKRVYFETAALLPALDQTISFEGGSVTEYLGDGVLGLFSVDKEDRAPDIGRAHRAANNCIGDTRKIVNKAISERYGLPDIDLGVGLGFGNAIVQLVGVPSRMHPKILGPCVYYATKLSGGINAVQVNDGLHLAWPTSKGGTLKFTRVKGRGNVDGYRVG